MSTSRSDPRSAPRRSALLPGLVVAMLVLAGCSTDAGGGAAGPADQVAPGATTAAGAPAATDDPLIGQIAKAPDVVEAVRRVLDDRAAAVLAGDRTSFDEGVGLRDPGFVEQQHQYFGNLRQLPLQTLSYAPDAATLVRDGAAYSINVRVTLQLAGFDAVPVTTLDRYRFARGAAGKRLRLVSVSDAGWEQRNHVQSEPWDTGAVQVRTGAGVLGIFDAASVAQAGPLIRSVESGISAVSALVPYAWPRTVVVYALSDDTFLSSIPDLPGGDPDDLDAIAFPVLADATATIATPADAASPPVAGVRLVLHSRMLARTGPTRDRLLRHELTHAAVGAHDDHAPVWLSEGLAEWVSVQAEAPADRAIAKPALAAARVGFTDLPADAGFNDDDSAAEHYGLAWWACEYVALTAGQPALWTLLDQLDALGVQGTLDRASEDAVLTTLVGVNARTLARKAGKLLLATFEPAPVPPPVPVPVPVPALPAPVVPPPVSPTA